MCVGGPDPSDRFGLPGWLKLASGVELAGMPGLFANAQPFAGSGVFLACSSTPSVFPSGGLDQLAGCGLFDVDALSNVLLLLVLQSFLGWSDDNIRMIVIREYASC